MKPLAERFFTKVIKTDGCWEWIGAIGSSGYGHMYVGGKLIGAHRISYEFANGPIPDGILVLHKCDNKRCVNPQHLRLGSQHENMIDMHKRHPRKTPPSLTFKGRHHTQKAREKLSIAATGNKRCVGRKLSDKLARDKNGKFISAAAHPEIERFRKVGEPSISIRKV